MDKKWLCAPHFDTDLWDSTEYYDTKQEAINATIEVVEKYNADPCNVSVEDELGYYPDDESKITSFAVGQAIPYAMSINVDYLIEEVQEQAYSDCGESSDGFLQDVTKEDKEELEGIILDWFDKKKYKPAFYKIENIEEVSMEGSK